MLAFYEPRNRIWGYEIDIDVMAVGQNTVGLPSLLGRDILDSWRMTYAPLAQELTFEVLQADLSVPVRGDG